MKAFIVTVFGCLICWTAHSTEAPTVLGLAEVDVRKAFRDDVLYQYPSGFDVRGTAFGRPALVSISFHEGKIYSLLFQFDAQAQSSQLELFRHLSREVMKVGAEREASAVYLDGTLVLGASYLVRENLGDQIALQRWSQDVIWYLVVSSKRGDLSRKGEVSLSIAPPVTPNKKAEPGATDNPGDAQ